MDNSINSPRNNISNDIHDESIQRYNRIYNLISLLINNTDNDLESILNESINGEKKKMKAMCHTFKEKLKKINIGENEVNKKLSCAICQEIFIEGERAIELPCNDGHHFFHYNETNEKGCPGINPWIEENNTCPVCRCQFPSEPEPEPEYEPEPEPEPEIPVSLLSTADTELSHEQIERLRGDMDIIDGIDINTNVSLEERFENINTVPIPIHVYNTINMGLQNNIEPLVTNLLNDIYSQMEERDLDEAIKRSLEGE